MSKVELYERFRKDHERNKSGVRRLAKEHHVHRRGGPSRVPVSSSAGWLPRVGLTEW